MDRQGRMWWRRLFWLRRSSSGAGDYGTVGYSLLLVVLDLPGKRLKPHKTRSFSVARLLPKAEAPYNARTFQAPRRWQVQGRAILQPDIKQKPLTNGHSN